MFQAIVILFRKLCAIKGFDIFQVQVIDRFYFVGHNEKKLIIGIIVFKINTSMALRQRQSEKNSTTSSLTSDPQFCSKAFNSPMQDIYTEMSLCLQRSQELCSDINLFCRQYKCQQSEIRRLEQEIQAKRKKHGFRKNQQGAIIQEFPHRKSPYKFSPTIVNH